MTKSNNENTSLEDEELIAYYYNELQLECHDMPPYSFWYFLADFFSARA